MSTPKRRPIEIRQTLPKVQNPATISDNDFSPDIFFSGLKEFSLEELATQYTNIDSQFQMMKGCILLAARENFPSNQEFGEWVSSVHALCADGQQVRNRYMHLANFFKNRPMTGISLTAAYEISKPDNENIAEDIYQQALNNNLSVSAVKKLIKDKKNSTSILSKPTKQHIDSSRLSNIVELVNSFNLPNEESIALLKAVITKFRKISDNVIDVEMK